MNHSCLKQLSAEAFLNDLMDMLLKKSEDFREDRHRCDAAVEELMRGSDEEARPSARDDLEAVHKQGASNLIFSVFLGFRANLEHFIDPVARTFMDVDFEVFLRENAAKRLPEYERAQALRSRFYASLPPAQREVYEDVAVYAEHLETVIPKLGHYYGFLLGDILLPRVVPGYCPDRTLTARYGRRMEAYLGIALEDGNIVDGPQNDPH